MSEDFDDNSGDHLNGKEVLVGNNNNCIVSGGGVGGNGKDVDKDDRDMDVEDMGGVGNGGDLLTQDVDSRDGQPKDRQEKTFVLKKWNCCAMWSWDCECDTCAICRVQVMDACLRCQSDNRSDDCVVVWGECNHSFHNCCMSLWVQQNNRCPLCQQDWIVQRIGK